MSFGLLAFTVSKDMAGERSEATVGGGIG